MLGKKIEDIKVGLSYVEDHNIPVTEANLKFPESIQGKNLEESQQLFQERIEALDREIHDMPTKEGVF
jgi:hypothetical protein